MDPKELRKKAKDLLAKAKALLVKETLTDDERTQADTWISEAEQLEAKAKKLDTILATDAELEQAESKSKGTQAEVTKDAADQPFEKPGEFFKAVKHAAQYPGQADVRLKSLKATGLSEGVPADGGYLVPKEVATGIQEREYQGAQILPRIQQDPVTGNSMTYNGLDESSRVDGSRWGGIRGYWGAEGGALTSSRPKWHQYELKLKKVHALCYATDELLEDNRALESWLTRTVPEELRFQKEDAIFEGDGVGKPLGIMNSPCLITVDRDTASRILVADIVAMWARRWAGVSDYVWLINQDAEMQLPQLTISNTPVYLPPGGLSGAQFGSLFGKPVIPTEYSASLNTTGDIMLASLSQYQAISKGGVKSDASMHVAFLTDEMVFRFTERFDGQPSWQSALTPFKGTNTQGPFVVLKSAT